MMDKSVNITPKPSGCSTVMIKPCMVQLTNVGVFKIVNGEIGENISTCTQIYCTADPVPCRGNQNHMDSRTAKITQKPACNGSRVKDINRDNQFLVKGNNSNTIESNGPRNCSGIGPMVQSRDQNRCVAGNSSNVQDRSQISVEMETQNDTRMTPNISNESELLNMSMKNTFKRPVRACRIKPVSYIDDSTESDDNLSDIDVVQTCSERKVTNKNNSEKTFSGTAEQGSEKDVKRCIKGNCKDGSDTEELSDLDVVQTCSERKVTNKNNSEKTFSGTAEQGSEKDVKRGIKGNCKDGSDTEERNKQSKSFNKNGKNLKDTDTNVQMGQPDLLKSKSKNELNLPLPDKVTDEMIKGKLDKFFEWNAIHKCPLCQEIFIEKGDFQQHFKQSEKCSTIFNCRMIKSSMCYCKPCKYQTRRYKHFWGHMLKSGPHGVLGSSSFPKSYDLLDSVDKEFDSKFTLGFDNLRRKWFGSHVKIDQLTSSTASNNAKCDVSIKNKDQLYSVDSNKKTTREDSRYFNGIENNDDYNKSSCGSKNDCNIMYQMDRYDDDNDAFSEEFDIECADNGDGSDSNRMCVDVTRNNNGCVDKDHSYALIGYSSKNAIDHSYASIEYGNKNAKNNSCAHINCSSNNANIEGENSDCDFKFKIGYSCKYCGVVLKNRRSAVLHLKRTHISEQHEPPLQCDVCGKSYVDPNNLRNHKRTHIHASCQCNLCGVTFNSAFELKSHKRKHRGLKQVKKFNCKYCDKKFIDRFRRDNHQFVHTGEKPYICDECGSCFRVKASLNNHIMHRHTAKEEVKKVLCKVCGKTYSKLYFPAHKKSHEERRYKCNDCGKSFVLKHHLKSHLLSHTNVRLFKCSLCGFSFTLNHHLQSHLKTKHDVQNG